MGRLTMNGVWEETRTVARRHFETFVTFAAAFAFLPPLALGVAFPGMMSAMTNPDAAAALPSTFVLAALANSLLGFVGIFAIVAIAADPAEGGGRRVRESFAGALRGLGKFLLALLLIYVVVVVAGIALGIVVAIVAAASGGLGGSGAAAGGPATVAGPTVAAAILAVVLPVMLWLTARLSPMVGVFVREPVRVIGGVRRAWRLSRGSTWPIVGLLLLFVFASLAIGFGGAGLGAAFGVAGRLASGSVGVGALLFAIVTSALGAALLLYYAVALGVIYRQLSAGENPA